MQRSSIFIAVLFVLMLLTGCHTSMCALGSVPECLRTNDNGSTNGATQGTANLRPKAVEKIPDDFSRQQRAQFDDKTDRFPRVALPDVIPLFSAFWMDNRHLMMAVNALPNGWTNLTATPDPVLSPHPLKPGAYKIIIVDFKTGEIQEAPYAGELICYRAGRIAISISSEDGKHQEFWDGQYGEHLSQIDDFFSTFDRTSCTQEKRMKEFHIFHFPEVHETLKVDWIMMRTTATPINVFLLDTDEHITATTSFIGGWYWTKFDYLAFSNQYELRDVVGKSTGHVGILFSPDGGVNYIDADPFLASLGDAKQGTGSYGIGNGDFISTKIGTLWNFRPSKNSQWSMQGIYFRDNGKLVRLDDANATHVAVSPDGCGLFYERISGNSASYFQGSNPILLQSIVNFGRRSFVVMNLCQAN